MRNVLCWEPDNVWAIVNPDADEVPEGIFRAVHVDRPLWIWDGSDVERVRGQQIDAQGVFERFLDTRRRHVQMAIIGKAGSGKSHLVTWIRLQIPRDQSRVVLAIPKAGTSLRDIVDRLIKQLTPETRAPFEEEFKRVGTRTLNREQQRETILNNLSLALRGHHADGTLIGDRDLEQHLTEYLPALLHDPHFRKHHFLRPGSFVDEIADHVFAAVGTYDPRTERQTIRRRDLLFGGLDVKKASELAREALDALDNEESIGAAVRILDRHVDEAIAMALSFTGDRLITLMNELRKQFKHQGRSLIFLIEDLARLQGIDRALLQALIKQGDDDHCDLRWVFAITDGLYPSIRDTVQTRMDWVVDLNGSEAVRTQPREVAQFTSRYMNAIRLGPSKLQQIGPNMPIPNACEGCQHRPACHEAFGAESEMGLYPFTHTAVWRMAQRVDPNVEERFNPRIFQKQILRPLADRGDLLKAGLFPPEDFLVTERGRRLSLREIRKLENADPTDSRRRLAFLDLWSQAERACNLAPTLHEAFGLPVVCDFDAVLEPSTLPTPGPMPPDPQPNPEQDAVDAWAKGGTLPATLATNLRKYVYEALVEVIDWDAEGLERLTFAAPTGSRVPFRQAAIQFLRQPTSGTTTFQFVLPLREEEMLETAIALQALLTARNGGLEELEPDTRAALLECLTQWGRALVEELRALDDVGPQWDPVAAATELLALGAMLANEIVRSQVTTESLLRAVFADWRSPPDQATHDLADIGQKIFGTKEMLTDLIHARLGGGKGGNTGALLDPSRPLAAIRSLRRSEWRLPQEPPRDPISKELRELTDLYAHLKRRLPGAVEAEREARVGWASMLADELGGTKATELQRLVAELRDAIGGGALPVNLNALDAALADFEPRNTEEARIRAESLPSAEEIRVVDLGPARAGAMRSARNLIEALSLVVARAEAIVSLRLEGGGEGQTVLRRAQGEIRTDLELIDGHLAALGGAHAA